MEAFGTASIWIPAMNHFEFLVEDSSGKKLLEKVLPNFIGGDITFSIHSYRGIGKIPSGLRPGSDARKRILLDQLPRLIAGYGKAFKNDGPNYKRRVIVVCDLDSRPFSEFLGQLKGVVEAVDHKPDCHFCIAIEEMEAWLLGDHTAIMKAYPKAIKAELQRYDQDSICGTWEVLADVILPGGAKSLKNSGYQEIGRLKSEWAGNIGPHMKVDSNLSPSFKHFIKTLRL